MECARCGKHNQPGRATCELCGEPLSLKCEACNHTNGLTNRFCGQCGSPLPGRLAPPDQTAQRVLRTLSSKGGERKRLTILFADIRGSTQLIDSLGDPELAMQRLDPVLNLMKEAVHRYDGVVNKTQGDGVMALFGAPLAHEDNAVRAAYAALDMQKGVRAACDDEIAIRVGLHAGEVPREVHVGIPPRDRLAVAVTKPAQHEALGLDHSVRTALVKVATGTNPTFVLSLMVAVAPSRSVWSP